MHQRNDLNNLDVSNGYNSFPRYFNFMFYVEVDLQRVKRFSESHMDLNMLLRFRI